MNSGGSETMMPLFVVYFFVSVFSALNLGASVP